MENVGDLAIATKLAKGANVSKSCFVGSLCRECRSIPLEKRGRSTTAVFLLLCYHLSARDDPGHFQRRMVVICEDLRLKGHYLRVMVVRNLQKHFISVFLTKTGGGGRGVLAKYEFEKV